MYEESIVGYQYGWRRPWCDQGAFRATGRAAAAANLSCMTYPRIIWHLDMNSYFASVEQQANPQWRGRPLGVAAGLYRGACLIATSKEAKAKGVVTGMRVADGLTRDPRLVIVEVDPAKVRSTTERIFAIVAEYSEAIETYSIDEAFVDLTGWVRTFDEAAALAKIVQRRIQAEVGEWLKCSMGLAPTRWLAKFGSDTAPKGELVVLTPNRLSNYLTARRLTEAWGIAQRLERRLKALGIHTLSELRAYPVANLIEAFGMKGYELWANVNAVELGGVQEQGLPKSIGHSHVLKQRTRDARFHRAVLMKLVERTGRRLRSLELEARRLWFGFATAEGSGGGDVVRLPDYRSDNLTLFRVAAALLKDQVGDRTPTALMIGVSELRPRMGQLPLWPLRQPAADVSAALDAVNDRYGDGTVRYGAQFGLSVDAAPDRIGFRKTVSWDLPLDQRLFKG